MQLNANGSNWDKVIITYLNPLGQSYHNLFKSPIFPEIMVKNSLQFIQYSVHIDNWPWQPIIRQKLENELDHNQNS